MDSARFDAWIRALGLNASRRTTLHGLLGATLVTSLLSLPNLDADAKKKHKKRKKRKKRKNKGGNDGCQAGETDCGNGVCADLTSDPNNCGACGVVSPSGECRNGAFGCLNADDCPEGCNCVGGAVCGSIPICTDDQCGGDEECPLGSACACISTFAPAFCSNLCNPA